MGVTSNGPETSATQLCQGTPHSPTPLSLPSPLTIAREWPSDAKELSVRSFLRRFARFTLNAPSIAWPTLTTVALRHQIGYRANVFSR